MRTALAIRPYGDHIREKVFKVLQGAGLEVSAPAELRDADNQASVATLKRLRADVLVVPFNAMRTATGDKTNGHDLLRLVRAEVAWAAAVPVVMPVSVFAKVAYEGAQAKHPVEHVFALFEDELESPATPGRLRAFLG